MEFKIEGNRFLKDGKEIKTYNAKSEFKEKFEKELEQKQNELDEITKK